MPASNRRQVQPPASPAAIPTPLLPGLHVLDAHMLQPLHAAHACMLIHTHTHVLAWPQGQWRLMVPFNLLARAGYPYVLQIDDDLFIKTPYLVRAMLILAVVAACGGCAWRVPCAAGRAMVCWRGGVGCGCVSCMAVLAQVHAKCILGKRAAIACRFKRLALYTPVLPFAASPCPAMIAHGLQDALLHAGQLNLSAHPALPTFTPHADQHRAAHAREELHHGLPPHAARGLADHAGPA